MTMLIKRIIAGILVAIFFASLLALSIGPLLFGLLLILSGLCQYEFYTLAKKGGKAALPKTGIALGTLWLVHEYLFRAPSAPLNDYLVISESLLFFLIFFIIAMIVMFDSKETRKFEAAGTTLFGIAYMPILLGFFFRLAQWDATTPLTTTRAGVFLVFFMCLVIKMSDTGAFSVGLTCAKTIGTHRLAPTISPKKSWEGFIGGIVIGSLVAALMAIGASKYQWGPEGIFWAAEGAAPILSLWKTIIVAAILIVVGVFGDLIESTFKRAADIKDSASLFPGMGGLLDVIDSLVFIPALFYAILKVLSIKFI